MELSTEIYTHIGIKKDKSQIYITSKGAKDWENTRKDGYGGFLVLRDLKGFVVFKGTADLIEELQEIDVRISQKKNEEKVTENEYARAVGIRNKKQSWTRNKLQEMTDEEIQYFIDMAHDKLSYSLKNQKIIEKLGPNYLNEYGMCLLRKYFHCPYK